MKKFAFFGILALLIAVVYLFAPAPPAEEDFSDIYADTEGELLLPQHNMAIGVINLEKAGLSFLSGDDINALRELEDAFYSLYGVVKVESILSASRVISQGDDIIVARAVPSDPARVSDSSMAALARELPDFPELSPYVSQGQETLLFYLYYGNDVPARRVYDELRELQGRMEGRFPFEFTGKGPIIAGTEHQLTKDVAIFFPLLLIMVILVLSLFRSLRALLVALALITVSVVFSYGVVHFLGVKDSPLLLLVPVFGVGLLSDYLIHYFYHAFHGPVDSAGGGLKKLLLFPLSLTALSTVMGFLSLSLIGGSGHLQLGMLIALAVVVTWGGVFFWADYLPLKGSSRSIFPGFQVLQGRLFAAMARYRTLFLVLLALGVLLGALQIPKLSLEPYPIKQLPEETTLKQADRLINEDFYGTVSFFLEVDTGEKQGVLKKETLLGLEEIHRRLEDGGAGYSFSLLTVLRRMHFYFMGSEDTLLGGTEYDDFFDALIEQYLLYYSSSVDPLEYESLLDNNYRICSVKGLLYYRDYRDLDNFTRSVADIRSNLPEGWSLTVHGMVEDLLMEQDNLERNWIFSFLAGGVLIFITVLIFYRKIMLALISLVPGIISMVISFGIISVAGISIDAFSIIFVAIITGLVIDYSIHTLVALDHLEDGLELQEGFRRVIGFSGIPIFLSFLTSLLSFSVLFLSSFRGARILGLLLFISLILSFFLSLYLIPLLILPGQKTYGGKT